MSEIFIARPADLLRRQMGPRGEQAAWFEAGMMAMALEILTVIKTVESLPIVDEGARQETVSVLHTLLMDLDVMEKADELYARLNEARKPKFVAEPYVQQPDADDVEPPRSSLDPSRASLLASQLRAEQELLDTDALPGSDQTTDPASSESEPQEDGEASSTPSS